MPISITLDDAEVKAVIDALPSHIFRATRSATWHTTQFAQKKIEDGLAIKTNIPSLVFRDYRIKKRLAAATKGVVWIGTNKVKARHLGVLQQDDYGAWADDYFFPDSFIARMKSGHTGIFKRQGAGRLPIVEQGVNIKNQALDVAKMVAIDSQNELIKAFIAKVRELNPHLK